MLLSLLFACVRSVGPEETTLIDARIDVPAPPSSGLQLMTSDMVIEPYSERQLCHFGTYEGEDIGIRTSTSYQNPEYGHHAFLLATIGDEGKYPDGTFIDCSGSNTSTMLEMIPMTMPTQAIEGGIGHMELPEGMAIRLHTGDRWVIQSHYVNTTPNSVLVRDVVNLETTPIDEVQTFASAYAHVDFDFQVPPGEVVTAEIDCAWETDVDILAMAGHMHEWGRSYSVDLETVDGLSERIYDVPEWDPAFRDAPPIYSFAQGEMSLAAGDRFRTRCTWENDTDETLSFPAEMCTLSGIVYPAEEPVLCFN